LNESLDSLKDFKQFTLWTLTKDGRKLPIDYRTKRAYVFGSDWQNDEDAVTDYETVERLTSDNRDLNIAFLLKETDPFFFLDIDKCIDEDGATSDVALKLIDTFKGCAVEVSSSKTGYHIIGKADVVDHRCKNIDHKLELYTSRRFIALTGFNATGDAGVYIDKDVMNDVVDLYFKPSDSLKGINQDTGCIGTIHKDWDGIKCDEELIQKACQSRSASNVFGGKCSFKDLWDNNTRVIKKFYSDEKGELDNSSIDAAIAQHLAFWTGGDGERIHSIMLNSKHKRDKWYRPDSKYGTYLKRTIRNACSRQKEYHSVEKKTPKIDTNGANVKLLNKSTKMSIEDQIKLFNGCIYIVDDHCVITPDGHLLKKDQFNVIFGGYTFFLDTQGCYTTTNAWKAFTESQALEWPKVLTTCFKPLEDSLSIIEKEGILMVNSYVTRPIKRIKGDVSLFINHIEKILPNGDDSEIILSYMAACVQYAGYKFQWCPLIIGAPGNGKTLISRCIEKALGERYCHMPMSNELNEKYNAWLFKKLFIGIEDVYVPEHKAEVVEILKPMITNDRIACRAMHADQKMMDNFANFVLNSNHLDGLKKHRDDRRLCVFHTAQMNKNDLKMEGMDDAYFTKLYGWLENDGYEMVTNFLFEYEIPDKYNPKPGFCNVAPVTSSTEDAIEASMGAVEQEILEVIEEDSTPGMCGGWISSVALEALLKRMNAAKIFPRKKRRDLMESLGFKPHDALYNGRSHMRTHTDGGRATLYIKNGHECELLTDKFEVVKKYDSDQQLSTNPFLN
jgi:hypothetical protein